MTKVKHTLLIVEDDPVLSSVLNGLLVSAGYKVIAESTIQRALLTAKHSRPDMIIMDLGLPDGDGTTLVKSVREFSQVPICILSAREDESQKVIALDFGADDYLTKPFSSPELLARVRAGLRRTNRGAENNPILKIGTLHIDLNSRVASDNGTTIHFTNLEYRVLECLALNVGLIVTHKALITHAWGPNHTRDHRSLRSYIKSLRQKIEPFPDQPKYLKTEVGVGYRLIL